MAGKERQSNIELLRVVAMLAVVMVHLDGASLTLPKPPCNLVSVSARSWWIISVEAVTIIGVNCFTLISGYFGIHARSKGLAKFTLQCLFYSVLIYLASAVIPVFSGGEAAFSWLKFAESWLVFTHTDLWYVPAYLGLYLLSPLLNAGVKCLKKRDFALALMAFIVYNVWAGWLCGGKFNQNGYTLIQLVMMYLIGRYIGEYCAIPDACRSVVRRWSIAVYVCSTAAIAVMAVYVNAVQTFAYNSPLVLASSVSLFMMFATFRIRSKAVNWLAASSFAVYLVHKNPYVWVSAVRPLSRYMWSHFTLAEYTVLFLLGALAIYLAASVIDSARRALFAKLKKLN